MSHCASSLLMIFVSNLQNVSGCLPFYVLFLLMIPNLGSSLIILIIGYQHVSGFFPVKPVNVDHLLLLSLYVLSICYSSNHLTVWSDKAHYVTLHHSKCVIFELSLSVFVANDLYLSSVSFLILAINIWCLVLHFYCFLCVFNMVEAVIIIFKHANFLKLSYSSAQSALTHAEMDFWVSKIDLKIQEYLVASSYKHSVKQFAHFIMATDIGLFILASIGIISHQAFTSIVLVFSWKDAKKRHWFERFWLPVL